MKRPKFLTFLVILFLSCFQVELKAQDAYVRHVPDSIVNRFRNGKGYEYANDPAYWKKPSKRAKAPLNLLEMMLNPAFWKVVGYAFLGVVFLYVLYRLFANDVFYRKERKREILTDVKKDLPKMDEAFLTSQLRDYLHDGKYKEAIRTQYLLTLVLLERRGLIKLDPNATNHDYTDQLKDHRHSTAFSFLTRMYEYAWYGDVAVSKQDYAFAEKRFVDFKQHF